MWEIQNYSVFPKCSVRRPLCSSFFGGVTHFIPGTVRTNIKPSSHPVPLTRVPISWCGCVSVQGPGREETGRSQSWHTSLLFSTSSRSRPTVTWLLQKVPWLRNGTWKQWQLQSWEERSRAQKPQRRSKCCVWGRWWGPVEEVGRREFPACIWRTLLGRQSIANPQLIVLRFNVFAGKLENLMKTWRVEKEQRKVEKLMYIKGKGLEEIPQK